MRISSLTETVHAQYNFELFTFLADRSTEYFLVTFQRAPSGVKNTNVFMID